MRTKVNISQNMFVAEYDAEVLTPEEAEEREARYDIEGEGLYVLQTMYNNKRVIFDATYKSTTLGRLINHSKKHANILLRPPLEVEGKLRIGFIAKRAILEGEELFYDYDLSAYSKKDLPVWYTKGTKLKESDSQRPMQPCEQLTEAAEQLTEADKSEPTKVDSLDRPQEDSSEAETSAKSKAVFKRCQVPGCGKTVKRIWNHIHGSAHKDLSGM